MLSHQKVIRSIVSLLVFSISQVYIQASLTTPQAQAQDQAPKPMVGRLEVHGKKQILVDSNSAESGATILDAQTLVTSNCASGTVHLLPVGSGGAINDIAEVELAANSKAVINYSPGKVKVTLTSGCARVQTALDIDATIVLPDGSSLPAAVRDTSDRKRVEACYPLGIRGNFTPSCGVPGAVYGAVAAGGIAGVVAAVTLNRSCNRALDTSTNLPTGACQ